MVNYSVHIWTTKIMSALMGWDQAQSYRCVLGCHFPILFKRIKMCTLTAEQCSIISKSLSRDRGTVFHHRFFRALSLTRVWLSNRLMLSIQHSYFYFGFHEHLCCSSEVSADQMDECFISKAQFQVCFLTEEILLLCVCRTAPASPCTVNGDDETFMAVMLSSVCDQTAVSERFRRGF